MDKVKAFVKTKAGKTVIGALLAAAIYVATAYGCVPCVAVLQNLMPAPEVAVVAQ